MALSCQIRFWQWAAIVVLATAQAPGPYLRTPTLRQLRWHQMEYYAFLHFGPNTFTDEEWGKSQSGPDVFNPANLSTDNWAKTFADAGMSGMILTAKHHDGMALWNTSTTTYKIGNSAWAKQRSSQGLDADVVRMAADSAKRHGIKFGVYLSPWDIHRDPAMPKPGLRGTIYDEPQIFGDSTPGDYNEFYTQQLTELVTMRLIDGSPVELFEIWLDGASGSDTVQTFNWTLFRDVISRHQPAAVMWGHQGVDARWVGNEDGITSTTNWHTISRTQDQVRYGGSELQAGVRDGLYWAPAEADARIRNGWFFHPNERPKTANALMDMYTQSVGRSVNLLLDVPPDRTGQLANRDADALMEFKRLRDTFLIRQLTRPGLNVTASGVRTGNVALYGPANLIDGKADTYWALDDGQTTGWVEIDLGRVCRVDGFVLQEYIELGQRIGGYLMEAVVGGTYRSLVSGTSLGYKRIHKLSGAVESSRFRFRITQSNATPVMSRIDIIGVNKD